MALGRLETLERSFIEEDSQVERLEPGPPLQERWGKWGRVLPWRLGSKQEAGLPT